MQTAQQLITAPNDLKGFDCNVTVSEDDAALMFTAGYRYAGRYLPRVTRASYDISEEEGDVLYSAGLALHLVQHVSKPEWTASGQLGADYGGVAAREASAIGFLTGGEVACDLEEVRHGPDGDVLDFLREWLKPVVDAGFAPVLYVGYQCGLTANELFSLAFSRYWGAYNVDVVPAQRGFQMHQHEMTHHRTRANGKVESDYVDGIAFQFDVNLTMTDKLGGQTVLVAGPDWGTD